MWRDKLQTSCPSTIGLPLALHLQLIPDVRGRDLQIDTDQGIEVSDISTSKVTFAQMTDSEIEDYVKTGEPLQVAGGFTLDGHSAPFITHIEGDPSGIIGLSLPTLRKITINLGIEWSSVLPVGVAK